MNTDLKYLNDNKYFDVTGFLSYINVTYPESDGSDFVSKIIMNILNEAATEFNDNDMEFITRVAMMLNLKIDDVKQFADDLMVKTPEKTRKLISNYCMAESKTKKEKYTI